MDFFVFLHIEVPHLRKCSVWNAGGIKTNQKVQDNNADFSVNAHIHSTQILIFPKRNNILQPP